MESLPIIPGGWGGATGGSVKQLLYNSIFLYKINLFFNISIFCKCSFTYIQTSNLQS